MQILGLIVFVFLSLLQPATMTPRECMEQTGYTRSTYEVIDNFGYKAYLESDLAGYDLAHLLDTPGVPVGERYRVILQTATADQVARFVVRAEGAGAPMPLDTDERVSRLRAHLYERNGENRRLSFIVMDSDGDGMNEVYAFVYAHLLEPTAVTPGGWHGKCLLELQRSLR